MKKKIYNLILIIGMLWFIPDVEASSCSVSASSSSVTVGSKVTIYVKGSDAIGRFNLNSSNTNVLSGASSTWVENSTSSVTFTAKGVGTSRISVSPQAGLSNSNGNEINIGCNSVTITVKNKTTSKPTTTKPSTPTKPKSSVNNLKSLEIEGAELSPKFDKGTTEYDVKLPKNTEKIKIKATKEDSKSSISGDGEKSVSEGMNKFEITVTAENGYKKKYVINVEVEEDPINVKVGNDNLSVVKKENAMPEIPNYYDKTTVKINDVEVPAYKGTITNYLLVGLKDREGKIDLYKYDEKNNKYEIYNEIKFNQISVIIKSIPSEKIPSNYKKYTETINEKELEVYKLSKNSKYSLVYGMNIETGKENLYKYDSIENTLQIFEREEEILLEKKVEKYEKLIMILGGAILILILLVTIGFTRKPKQKNIVVEKVEQDFLTKKEIKKIEKENKKINKKNKNKEEA